MSDGFIDYVIEHNKHIPFVDRIINKDMYPVIENPDGSVSTHLMSWGETEGKYIVFPMIEMLNDELVNLQDAGINPIEYAIKKGNFISFDTPEEADYFSKNYKTYWENKSGKFLRK